MITYNSVAIPTLKNNQISTSRSAQIYKNKLDFAQLIMQSDSFSDVEKEDRVNNSLKPSPNYLSELTGLDTDMAADTIFIGNKEDTRDWNKIMSSDNVLTTLLEENKKMYGEISSDNDNQNINNYNYVAKTDNLAVVENENGLNVFFTTSSGEVIQTNLTTQDISEKMFMIGADTQQLNDLVGLQQQYTQEPEVTSTTAVTSLITQAFNEKLSSLSEEESEDFVYDLIQLLSKYG